MTITQPIGAHVPTAGGLARTAIDYTERIRGEAVQVFVTNPRGWARPTGDPGQDAVFRAWAAENHIPVFIHASMLVNIGSPDPIIVERSVATLQHALTRGAAVGARGVIFHAGSSITPDRREAALTQAGAVLLPLLDGLSSGDPDLLVEPTAGGGQPLASVAADLGPYLDAVLRHPRLGVCLDTCHMMAAGHDISSPDGMVELLDAVGNAAGPDRLRLIHANDSKDPCGSHRDRHETIGDGTIGIEPFGVLFTHPVSAGVPLIVETPAGNQGLGHGADIDALRAERRRFTS